ncbi:MAG TPA: nitronate monooxygenase, partial [Candidatus Elarobacter sp.]
MSTSGRGQRRDLIIGVTPFETPNAELAAALSRAGALGILDLGRDGARARTALAQTQRWTKAPWGVRVPPGCTVAPHELPSGVTTVVLPHGSPWSGLPLPGMRVLAEVNDLGEARLEVARGVDGLIARGTESGGRVGDLTTYVLLQQLFADDAITIPIWAAGGIGRHSAAAAIAGGAAGVVLDAQLALLRETALPRDVTAAIAAMDGSETTVIARHRVYTRPDLAALRAHWPDLAGGVELGEPDVAARLGAGGFAEHLLPIGQDGATARVFADEFGTAAGLVRGLRSSMEEHLAGAAAVQPLGAGSRFASARGIRVPVVQGPMTRVSDRAAFAAEVAENGGLPFLALA